MKGNNYCIIDINNYLMKVLIAIYTVIFRMSFRDVDESNPSTRFFEKKQLELNAKNENRIYPIIKS
jgi:hypothetical protein